MIVRENETAFICIEQNHHAHISKQIISNWQAHFLHNDPLSNSVLYAIEQHDVGWHHFDRQPLWNDFTDSPYTFTDLPLLIKTVLYTNGINIVAERNPYAAVLCSKHYTEFMKKYHLKEIKQFIDKEQLRRKTILQYYPEVDEQTFLKHLSLLQLADHFSLYICLHDPGNNEYKHPYFKKGIRIPQPIDVEEVQYIQTKWQNDKTIVLKQIPDVDSFAITLREKTVPKQIISEKGWLKSYDETPFTERTVHFVVA